MIKVYHNASCSKSNECLAFLDKSGKTYEVVEYLKTPPTADELIEVIRLLGIKPIELVRQKQEIWIGKFTGKNLNDDEVIAAMCEYPQLIERPIVINGDKAIIARPLEKAASII